MQNIAFYLQKYSKIGFKQESFKKCLIDAVQEVCNIVIDQKQIKITNDTIFVNVVGVEKSEIFLNKEKINKVFNTNLESKGGKSILKNII